MSSLLSKFDKLLSSFPWSSAHQQESHATLASQFSLLNTHLPPYIALFPSICRLIALLIVLPILSVCLLDFVGYAIFRTLGFRRRRVRVKRALSSQESARAGHAPVLTPGTYDADALLRHRARSVGSQSAEAVEEWTRTGGRFARVSHIRASRQAATPSDASLKTFAFDDALSTPDPATGTPLLALSPPESPSHAFARVGGVGVEGALGYFDTDVEDSGAESGRNSPEMRRSPAPSFRKGLAGSSLGFTPVLSEQLMTQARNASYHSSDVQGDRSPRSVDSTSSWIGIEGGANATAAAAAAADLEPTAGTPA